MNININTVHFDADVKLEDFVKEKCRQIGKVFMVNNKKTEWFLLTPNHAFCNVHTCTHGFP